MVLSDWVQVGELAGGFQHASNAPAASAALIGKKIELHRDNDEVIRYHFIDRETLEWEILAGDKQGKQSIEQCRVSTLRHDIYLVDFTRKHMRATQGTLLLNLKNNYCIGASSQLADKMETEVSTFVRASRQRALANAHSDFYLCGIGQSLKGINLPRSRSLVGKRIAYRYSDSEVYEHIYLNENLYCWHCLEGIEQGLADTDNCECFKVSDDLYLLFWHEKIIPTVGTLLIDLKAMRTTGKLFGYVGADYGKTQSIPVGAKIESIKVAKEASSLVSIK